MGQVFFLIAWGGLVSPTFLLMLSLQKRGLKKEQAPAACPPIKRLATTMCSV